MSDESINASMNATESATLQSAAVEDCHTGWLNLPDLPWLYDALSNFRETYVVVHPALCVVICSLGTVMNMMTIVVLTRKSMLNAINMILSAVALCDIVVMLSNLTFVTHYLILAELRCDVTDYSYSWAQFMWLHANVSVIGHSCSLWLTVALATIRVVSVRRSTSYGTGECLSIRGSIGLSIAMLFVVTLINAPNMYTFAITQLPVGWVENCVKSDVGFLEFAHHQSRNSTASLANHEFLEALANAYFEPVYAVIATKINCSLTQLAFWANGFLFKVVPCVLLSVFIGFMLKLLKEVNARRKGLGMNASQQNTDKTTNMLVAVLSVFLITELPQGVLNVFSGIFVQDFQSQVYQNVGDLMDLLSLINSSVNFVIYCTMSQKFRNVFEEIFVPAFVSRSWTQSKHWANAHWSRLQTNAAEHTFSYRQPAELAESVNCATINRTTTKEDEQTPSSNISIRNPKSASDCTTTVHQKAAQNNKFETSDINARRTLNEPLLVAVEDRARTSGRALVADHDKDAAHWKSATGTFSNSSSQDVLL